MQVDVYSLLPLTTATIRKKQEEDAKGRSSKIVLHLRSFFLRGCFVHADFLLFAFLATQTHSVQVNMKECDSKRQPAPFCAGRQLLLNIVDLIQFKRHLHG